MSLHLIECVRPLKLGASAKLALMAFADSADAHTQIAFPGLEAVMEWANVSKSQAQALVSDLAASGYLRKHRAGHRGRRAEYIVFPEGCCDAHPRPGADDTTLDVVEIAAALGVPTEALQAVVDQQTGDTPMPPDSRTQTPEKASGTLDSSGGIASGQPDPFGPPYAERVRHTGTNTPKGTGKGPADRTPSPTATTSPPTPHASGAGGASCALHGNTPAANCRGCGTTGRQLRAAAVRAAAEQTAADSGPRCPGGYRWYADDTCGCPPPVEHQSRGALDTRAAS